MTTKERLAHFSCADLKVIQEHAQEMLGKFEMGTDGFKHWFTILVECKSEIMGRIMRAWPSGENQS